MVLINNIFTTPLLDPDSPESGFKKNTGKCFFLDLITPVINFPAANMILKSERKLDYGKNKNPEVSRCQY